MSSSDQKIFDLIILTIGVLIGVAVVIFIIARDLGNENMARMQLNDPAYQEAVVARIEPFGQLTLDGEAVAEDPELARVNAAEAAPALLTGPQVYNAACLACHGGGIGGLCRCLVVGWSTGDRPASTRPGPETGPGGQARPQSQPGSPYSRARCAGPTAGELAAVSWP